MIQVENLSYSFPTKELYKSVSFTLEDGQHCAFIGSNGTGKTTLVDMIIDPEKYLYDGKIIKSEECRIGYVNQFSKWVNQRLVYPESLKKQGIQGRVTLQFTVQADGTVSNVRVLRGVHPDLDNEAVRVVSSSPKWKPGKYKDKEVPVTYTFPVIFQSR